MSATNRRGARAIDEAYGRVGAYGSRYLLAAAGVAIGSGAMVLLALLVASGFSAATSRLRAMGANVLYVSGDARLGRAPFEPRLTMADIKALGRAGGAEVEAVVPVASLTGALEACGRELIVQVMGVTPEALAMQGWTVAKGRFLSDVDDERARAVVVLGAGVVEQLNCLNDPSERIRLSETKVLTRIGELESVGRGWLPGLDSFIVVPLGFLEATYGATVGASGLVRIQSERTADAVAARVRDILHRVSGLRADQLTVQSQAGLVAGVRTLEWAAQAVLGVLTGLGLLVAAVGVMNSVMTAVLERTPEIGLRRAVGATRGDIGIQFLFEALACCTAGGAVGCLAGAGMAWVLLVAAGVPFRFDWLCVAVPMVLATGFGALAGVVPARKAARLSPVEALRHE